jgi:hypothetical protein
MAQYAISVINDKRLLIDAAEFGWIKEHGSEDNTWADIESRPESERKLRLVYGCFLKNPSQVTGALDPKSISVMKGMEMAYVHFEPQRNFFYRWRSLKLLDIEILDQHLEIDRCAFVAIIDLAGEVPKTKTFSLSAFPFNSGLTVQQNIKTRLGILAINDEDRRNQRKLSAIDWRLLIDLPRARRAADRVQ